MLDPWGRQGNSGQTSNRSLVDTVNKAYGLGSTNYNNQAQYNSKLQQVRQLEAEVARLQEENSDKVCVDTWNLFIANKKFYGCRLCY